MAASATKKGGTGDGPPFFVAGRRAVRPPALRFAKIR